MANPLVDNFDTRLLFLGENRFIDGTYTNSSGSNATLTKGMVFGRVHSSDKVAITASASTNGSQVPRFILADDYSVANGDSATLRLCICGRVDENLVTLDGSDTFATTIALTGATGSPSAATTTTVGTIRDLLQDRGFFLENGVELTKIDNQ